MDTFIPYSKSYMDLAALLNRMACETANKPAHPQDSDAGYEYVIPVKAEASIITPDGQTFETEAYWLERV